MKIKRAIFVGSSLRLMNSYGNLFGIFGETVQRMTMPRLRGSEARVEALADWPTECTGSRRRTAEPPSRLGDFPDLRLINRRRQCSHTSPSTRQSPSVSMS
jgi:hypothetical protein